MLNLERQQENKSVLETPLSSNLYFHHKDRKNISSRGNKTKNLTPCYCTQNPPMRAKPQAPSFRYPDCEQGVTCEKQGEERGGKERRPNKRKTTSKTTLKTRRRTQRGKEERKEEKRRRKMRRGEGKREADNRNHTQPTTQGKTHI